MISLVGARFSVISHLLSFRTFRDFFAFVISLIGAWFFCVSHLAFNQQSISLVGLRAKMLRRCFDVLRRIVVLDFDLLRQIPVAVAASAQQVAPTSAARRHYESQENEAIIKTMLKQL